MNYRAAKYIRLVKNEMLYRLTIISISTNPSPTPTITQAHLFITNLRQAIVRDNWRMGCELILIVPTTRPLDRIVPSPDMTDGVALYGGWKVRVEANA